MKLDIIFTKTVVQRVRLDTEPYTETTSSSEEEIFEIAEFINKLRADPLMFFKNFKGSAMEDIDEEEIIETVKITPVK